jgi:magnesium-transporting ATPase (P-type)
MSNKNLNTFPNKIFHGKRSISKLSKIILLFSVIVVVSILTGYVYISALSNANSPINSLQNFEIHLN